MFREMIPGPYQTADERDVVVEHSVRTIQRYMRGLFGRRRASYLLQKKLERDSFLREQVGGDQCTPSSLHATNMSF